MSLALMNKIKQITVDEIPPDGAEPVGTHPILGKVLYKMKRDRGKNTPLRDPETGEIVYVKDSQGQNRYQKRNLVSDPKDYIFYLDQAGGASLALIPYKPPTPEEIAARERKARVESLREDFFEAAAEQGLTAEDLISIVTSGTLADGSTAAPEVAQQAETAVEEAEKAMEPQPDFEVEETVAEYPHRLERGRYELSNRTVFEGNERDAKKAEEDLHKPPEAKDDADEGTEEL